MKTKVKIGLILLAVIFLGGVTIMAQKTKLFRGSFPPFQYAVNGGPCFTGFTSEVTALVISRSGVTSRVTSLVPETYSPPCLKESALSPIETYPYRSMPDIQNPPIPPMFNNDRDFVQ